MKITEVSASNIINNVEFDVFKHELKKNCAAYLRLLSVEGFFPSEGYSFSGENQDGAIYRATKMPIGNYGSRNIRQDRKPRDMNPVISDLYSYYAEQQVGVSGLRSRSIFCTGVAANADSYGDYLYYVFPVDGTRYFYSPGVVDVMDSHKFLHMQEQFHEYVWGNQEKIEQFGESHGVKVGIVDDQLDIGVSPIVEQYVFEGFYKQNTRAITILEVDSLEELPALLKSGVELMVYGVPNFYYLADNYLKSMDITFKEFTTGLGLNL